MLDVHPLHAPMHTWKDFFLHIATIVIGLLIAVGLEQTVEYLHHRRQVKETRGALLNEQRKNIGFFALETDLLRQQAPVYRTDLNILMYLRSHPGAPASAWPGKLDWRWHGAYYLMAQWTTAQQDGVVEHMPAAEAQTFDDIYRRLNELYVNEVEEKRAIEQARRILFLYPDPAQATPAVLDEAIRAMSEVLVFHSHVALTQTLMARRHSNFGPVSSLREMDTLLGIPDYPMQGNETPGMDLRVNAIEAMHE
jgi:hypothetical protein